MKSGASGCHRESCVKRTSPKRRLDNTRCVLVLDRQLQVKLVWKGGERWQLVYALSVSMFSHANLCVLGLLTAVHSLPPFHYQTGTQLSCAVMPPSTQIHSICW